MKNHVIALAMVALSGSALAATQKVTLAIPSMDCPVCPITIKKALTRVAGVSDAQVDFAKRSASVTYDDTQTGVDALTRATKNVGYPSTVMGTKP